MTRQFIDAPRRNPSARLSLSAAALALLLTGTFPRFGAAQEKNPPESDVASPIGEVKFQPADTLDLFILVVNPIRIAYVLSGGSTGGMKSLSLESFNATVESKDCLGAESCRLSGEVSVESLHTTTPVFTAVAVASNGKTVREKLRVEFDDRTDKIYLVASLPALLKEGPFLLGAGAPASPAAPGGGEKAKEPPKGPQVNLTLQLAGEGSVAISASARDLYGVDFIELMKDGAFLDVQMCKGETACSLDKTLTLPPGQHEISIKSMNKFGGLTLDKRSIVIP